MGRCAVCRVRPTSRHNYNYNDNIISDNNIDNDNNNDDGIGNDDDGNWDRFHFNELNDCHEREQCIDIDIANDRYSKQCRH
jgi:hypothetical protein